MSRTIPDARRFRRLAAQHTLIPVVRKLLGDMDTPVSAFAKLRQGDEPGFLLESVEGGETWGRFSILGSSPAGRFRAEDGRVELTWRGKTKRVRAQDPMKVLAAWLDTYNPATIEGLPRFIGGAVGYVSYDAVRSIERIPDRHVDARTMPDVDLHLVSDLVVFDNLTHTMKLVACAFVEDDAAAAYRDAQVRLDAMEARLREPVPSSAAFKTDAPRPGSKANASPVFKSDTTERRFASAVTKAKDYIRKGDAFQIVLSHELSCRLSARPYDVYRALRRLNPSPYMFYLHQPERQILGASPEVLVRVEDAKATVRPIAGTRRRGANDEEDEALIAELLADSKERAEHTMLVDLGRNDLGRFCRFGSVDTERFMTVERYSHVIHLVSHVTGIMSEGKTCFDALRACFPAGTVSGAPKIRAMEIIDELEQRRRGVYAGAVGYFSFDGAMDTCIAIRTVVCEDGQARLGVGAGIVLDSDPSRELAETHEKANAARTAIEMAERGLE